ncbi:MAG TPA: alpha/beta fold hydrolase [Sphingopyxis sp.]|nr:alpha/beta fold hydrolase [Sphingopyxis sp.]HMP45369.1 alpha/beta fold hydrolase [Sphingopyxis sp.]HMQ18404.1 alpha/beta fold hydrolase [Sphingopyxis sp.]
MIPIDVRFPSARALLAGTLLLPRGAGPFPAAVLAAGSGHHDRDESVCGHAPLRAIAEHLASFGIATLRFDGRGVGASGGETEEAGFEMKVADLLSASRHLARDERIAANRIAFVGHSEGGLVAAAASRIHPAPVVMLAGPAIPISRMLHRQARALSVEAGASEMQLRHEKRMNSRVFAELRTRDPSPELRRDIRAIMAEALRTWPEMDREDEAQIDETASRMADIVTAADYHSLLRQRPAAILAAVTSPLLALFGEYDWQVEAGPNRRAFDRTTTGNPHASAQILARHNHLFQIADTGLSDEYGHLGPSPSLAALASLTEWLERRLMD